MGSKKITRKAAIRELWKRGNLDYKLHDAQILMKKFIKSQNKDIITILCARRFGKSFLMCVLANEVCQGKPNAVVKYICPKLKMVKVIIAPIMREILKDCPEDMKPEWKENDKVYRYPNGSEIHLAGTDNESHEALRGGEADLCIVDEAGFCDKLDYVIESVLAPTTDHTDGKIILASTPSKTSDHPFIERYVIPAQGSGELLKFIIHDNPLLSEKKIKSIAARYPLGEKDPAYRREYLCEILRDSNAVVLPEFSEDKQSEIVKDVVRPPYFDIYVSGDIGFKDLTVFLFGYWDFMNAKLVIEDEIVMNGPSMTTDSLANAILQKEAELFSDESGIPIKPFKRVMDNNLIMVNDFQRLHNLSFTPTAKDDKEAQINNLRIMLMEEKIIISPKCKHLIYHMKNALWDKKRKSFERMGDTANFSIRGGHADGVDALVYMVRNLNRMHNPYPENWERIAGSNVHYSHKKEYNQLENIVKKMFNIKG